jgi:surfeit locus 1 family protein
LTQDISIRPRSALLSATIATGIALAILLWLGVWQIHRLHWKEGLLAQIAAAERAPPAELSGETPKLFARVEAHGVLRGDKIALYGAEVRGNRMGAQQAEILDRVGEKPLLVVLGWVPTDAGAPVPISGPRDITGYIRLPEHPNWLSAPDDLEARRFYTLNPTTIAASLGAADAAPLTLVALRNPLGAALPTTAPQPADALPEPVNNHLEYALTWFGLAGALVAVFGVWAMKRGR